MYTYITGHLKEKQSCLGVKQPRNGVYEGRIRRKYRYLPYCLLQTTVISGASKYQAYRVVRLIQFFSEKREKNQSLIVDKKFCFVKLCLSERFCELF